MSIGGAFNIIGKGPAGLFRSKAGEFTPSIGSVIATAHHDRVIAAGGVMPVTAAELASLLNPICTAYNITTTAQFNTQFPTFSDPYWTGYRAGAGAGVTLGRAVQVVYSINPAADAVQATAASQPLLLAWSGQNYYWGSGVAGNNVTTPNAAANQITGDIDLIAYSSFLSTENTGLIAKYGATAVNQIYLLASEGSGLSFYYRTGGSTRSRQSSVANPFLNSQGWVRVVREASTGNIFFYTSSNSLTTAISSIVWTQLGAMRSDSSGNLDASSQGVEVGSITNGTSYNKRGNILRATISNTIGGAPVVDFNPQLYNAATSQTQWTAATGEVWTINKSTGNTFAGKLVDRTYAMGNGTTTSMSVGLAATQTYTEYVSFARNGAGNLVARATGNTRQHTGTNITLNNGTLLNLANTSSISQIATYLSKGASSSIAANNGTPTAGNAGTNNGTNLTIMQGAHVFNGLVQSSTEDTTAQRLQMFNSLKLMARF